MKKECKVVLILEVFVNDKGEQYTNIYENYVPLRGDLGFEEEINADNNFEEREENFIIQIYLEH